MLSNHICFLTQKQFQANVFPYSNNSNCSSSSSDNVETIDMSRPKEMYNNNK